MAIGNNTDIDRLYKAISVPETGGVEDPYIRTKASEASSAYGPVQITYSLAEDYLNRFGDEFSPELKEYGKRFVDQGKSFINRGKEDPRYALGGKGTLGETPEDRAQYEQFAKRLMAIKFRETGGDIDKFTQSWRGVPEEQDPRYYAAVRENYQPQQQGAMIPGATGGNPQAMEAQMVKDLYGQAMPPTEQPEQGIKKSQNPSLSAYLKNAQTTAPTSATKKPVYSENLNSNMLQQALEPDANLRSTFSNLVDKTPEERAKIGGQLGGAIGLGMNGVIGSLIGSGIGAMAARAAGQIQSGERQEIQNKTKLIGAMQKMGVTNKEGTVSFKDGGSFTFTADPNVKLRNTSSVVSGKKTRSVYELDKSNPLTKAGVKLATPMAYYLNQGVMRYSNIDDKNKTRDLNSTINMLTNSVINDVDNVKTVVARAKELFKKMGVMESDIKNYLQTVKPQMSEDEYARLEEGVRQIYG